MGFARWNLRGGLVTGTELDYSRYFGQGDKVRLRSLRLDDAEAAFIAGLDSPSRQVLQLGTRLPTSLEGLRSFLEKRVDCKDANGVIILAVESLNRKNWELTCWFWVSPSSRSASWVQGHARGPSARSAVP